MYEVLLCCKLVINSSIGMDCFLTVPNAIETVVNCLNFGLKLLALQVLEILSVCSYYSTAAAVRVFRAFQVYYSQFFLNFNKLFSPNLVSCEGK